MTALDGGSDAAGVVTREEALRLAREYEAVANMKPNSISNREAYEVYGAMWTTPEAFRMARANLIVGLLLGAGVVGWVWFILSVGG